MGVYRYDGQLVEAKQLGDPAESASRLVGWMGGYVEGGAPRIETHEGETAVVVPVEHGEDFALAGDWIVRRPGNVYEIIDDAAFRAVAQAVNEYP
jgi:hypothetical protein